MGLLDRLLGFRSLFIAGEIYPAFRTALNLVAGPGIAINAVDNAIQKRTDVTITAQGVNIQIFTTSGTWTKPAGAKYVEVFLVGAAGGGGGGASSSIVNAVSRGTRVSPGNGGGPGGKVYEMVNASILGATVAVTVGAGGVGGVGSVNAAGTGGNAGGSTAFGGFCQAGGGEGASGGRAGGLGEASGIAAQGGVGDVFIGSGSSMLDNGSTLFKTGTSGGGRGGIISETNTLTAADTGGRAQYGGGSFTPANTAGASTPGEYRTANGGGGGSGSISAAGTAGGAGGTPGGGGGGGGPALGAFAAGNGGKGGDGWAMVITHL